MTGAWYTLRVNPEPWTAPSVAVQRRGGKAVPAVYKSAALDTYQRAVRSYLSHAVPMDGPVSLRFYFWRETPTYQADERKNHKHQADATNMQKALEDALQGCLFHNDRQVKHIESIVMDQGPDVEPRIVIRCAPFKEHRVPEIDTDEFAGFAVSVKREAEIEKPPAEAGGMF